MLNQTGERQMSNLIFTQDFRKEVKGFLMEFDKKTPTAIAGSMPDKDDPSSTRNHFVKINGNRYATNLSGHLFGPFVINPLWVTYHLYIQLKVEALGFQHFLDVEEKIFEILENIIHYYNENGNVVTNIQVPEAAGVSFEALEGYFKDDSDGACISAGLPVPRKKTCPGHYEYN